MNHTILAQRAHFLGKSARALGWKGRAVCLVSAGMASYLWANHFTEARFVKAPSSLTIEIKEGEKENDTAKQHGIHFTPSQQVPPRSQISHHLYNIGFEACHINDLLEEVMPNENVTIDALIAQLMDRRGNRVGSNIHRNKQALVLKEYSTNIEERDEKLFISTKVSGEVEGDARSEGLDDEFCIMRWGVYMIGATSSTVGVTIYNMLSKMFLPGPASLMHGIAMRSAQASLVGFVIAFPFLVYHHRLAVQCLQKKPYDIQIHSEKNTEVIITTGPKEEKSEAPLLALAALFGASVVSCLGYATGAVLGTALYLL